MKYKIKYTETFGKNIKKLKKKYPSILNDFSALIPKINKKIYKVRIPSSDMSKGKSGGFRTIYYLLDESNEIIFLTIYAKAKKDNIQANEIRSILSKM